MQTSPETRCHVRKCIIEIDKIVNEHKNEIDDFMEKSLKWCEEKKSMLKKKLVKPEQSNKNRVINVPPALHSRILDQESISKDSSTSANNVVNITEAHIQTESENLPYRTRGALRALQTSILTDVTFNVTEVQKTRARSRTRRTKQETTTVIKRTAEEGGSDIELISKKIKQEKLSTIETPPKSDDEVFKKPKPRTRKQKKEKQSASVKDATNEITIDEPITFNAVLHSSPNANMGENTFNVSTRNISVIPTSPRTAAARNLSQQEEITTRTSTTSNDFINDTEGEATNLGKVLMNEVDRNSSKRSTRNKSNRNNSKELSINSNEMPKVSSSKSDKVSKDDNIKKIGVASTESVDSSIGPNKKDLLDKKSGAENEDDLERSLIGGNDEVVDSPELNPAGSTGKRRNNRAESGRVIRETRSGKASHGETSSTVKPVPETDEEMVPLQELNSTKVVHKEKAAKRTKPVLKSKIFDCQGNILPSVKSEDVEENLVGRNDVIVDSSELSSAGSAGKSRSNRAESGRVARETRSGKASREEASSTVKPTSEAHEEVAPLQELNSTTVVHKEKATKRTKPILKSKVFDDQGNILLPVKTEKISINTNSPEKRYSLRSSPSTRESNMITDTKKPMETRQSCQRHSNAENEPEVAKSKRTKAKKTEKIVDNNAGNARITRTKSKEAKQALEKAALEKSILLEFAKKSLNKAKRISLQKEQTKAMPPLLNRLALQERQNQISASKLRIFSKEDILASCNKYNTSVMKAGIVNLGSQVKMSKVHCLKNNEIIMSGKGKYVNAFTDSKERFITPGKKGLSLDLMIKSSSKTTKEEEMEKELKLKALKEKEEEAQMKREMVIKMRQKELKEKTEKKLQSAAKQRKKIEMEKYICKIQSEKEKDEKRKLLLEKREIMKKEKARMKKEMMDQKLAETEERRRLEEEARIAKLKEQEAEQQRLMLEKQKELERHEKRAQERLAEQKAREKYEMKLKTEQMMGERQQQLAAQLQSANKGGMAKENQLKVWNYKSRNENDLGLDHEVSDLDSDHETEVKEKSAPAWAKRVMKKDIAVKYRVKAEAMMGYMRCQQKTPDIQRMFKMTPTKRIKRTSSAIWNTPSS